MTTHIPLHGSGTLPPLFYAEREQGAGEAALPSGISRRNEVTTHIPLHGGGTLPPLFYAERERGAGGAALPSGISRRNAVTTHIPLLGSGTLPRGAGGAALPGRMRTKNAVIRILLPGWCFFGVFDSFFSQTSMDGLIVTPNCCIF